MQEKKSLFILDTNVLLDDPHAIYAFQENDIIIPIAVIEEIDAMKARNDSLGFNARMTSRLLDGLREQGRLEQGVTLETGGILRIDVDRDGKIPLGLEQDKMDNRILCVAVTAKENFSNRYARIVVVSRDINMRIKANAYGMDADDYQKDRVEYKTSYTGMRELEVCGEVIEEFFKNGNVKLPDVEPFYPNECVHMTAGNLSALGIYKKDPNHIQSLTFQNQSPWGVRARNREQRFALELLLDDTVQLITLLGKAGTGKTLLALAAGLFKVTDETVYRRLLVARPVVPMGKDIGYLPGDKDKKLRPWMQPIYDNLELMLYGDNTKKRKEIDVSIEFLEQKQILQIEPLTYIRGRSIPDQYLIVDEAQNLSKHEIKTIITRAGKGTKIVLTGDPEQIDNPYLDENTNGLTYIADRFKDVSLAGHINLAKGERSPLAEIAARIL